MKHIKRLSLMVIILILVLSFNSCKKFGYLFTPTVTSSQEITNVKSPTWTWNRVPGIDNYQYKLVGEGVDAETIDWVAVEGGNVTELTLGEENFTTEGEYTLYIRGVSSNEEEPYTKSTKFSVTIDRTPPAVAVVDNYTSITNDTTPTWSWSAVEDALSYSVSLSKSGPWTILSNEILSYTSSSVLIAGTYEFYVKSVDVAGNWSEISAVVETIIDLEGFSSPEITLATPGVEVIEDDKTVKIVVESKPTWTWLMPASDVVDMDDDGDVDSDDFNLYYSSLYQFRYQLNSQRMGNWTEVNSDTLTFTPATPLVQGLNTLYIQASELISAGVYNWSPVVSATYKIDSINPESPEVSGDSTIIEGNDLIFNWSLPSDASYLRFKITNSLPVDLTLELTSGLIQEDVDSTSDGLDNWQITKLAYSQSSLVAGDYIILVQVFDAVGNFSSSGYFETSIESASSDSPMVIAVSSTPTNDPTPTWSWSEITSSKNYRYQLDSEAGSWIVLASSITTFTPTPDEYLNHGVHTLYVQALNQADVWSTSGSAVIDVDLEAPIEPSLNGDLITDKLQPVWSWTEGSGDTDGYRYRLGHALLSGDFDGAAPAWMQSDSSITSFTPQGNLEVNESDQDDNYYRFELEARDLVGNWCITQDFVTQIRTDVPASPIFDIEPTLISGKTIDVNPSWTWSDTTYSIFRYKLNNGSWLPNDSGDSTTSWSASALTEGSHDFYVQVYDGVLWSGSARSSLIIDLTGPIAVDVTGTAVPTSNRRPTWFWSVPSSSEEVGGFQWSYDDSTWTEIGLASTSFTPSSDLGVVDASTDVTLYVQSKDVLGNWSLSDSHIITIDTRTLDPPVVTSDLIASSTKPTWTWTAVTDAVLYRYSLNSDSAPWSETSALTYSSPLPLDGNNTLYVQAKSSTNLWSSSGSFMTIVDFTPPAAPTVTSAASTTSDKTPTWSWNDVSGAEGYKYRLDIDISGVGSWSSETTDLIFTPGSDLAEDIYTLYVQSVDDYDNWSNSGSFEVTVDYGSANAGLPKRVTLADVSKDSLATAIRIEWEVEDNSLSYNIYKITETQFAADDLVGTLLVTNTIENFNDGANGNKYYYDTSIINEENYYYRVSGENSEGEGQPSFLYKVDPPSVENSRGKLFNAVNSLAITQDGVNLAFNLNWIAVTNSDSYALLRTGPYASEQTSGALDSASWDFLESVGNWSALTSQTFSDMHNLVGTSYTDGDSVAQGNYFYYKVVASNSTSQANTDYQNEGVVTGDYYVSTSSYFAATIKPLPVNIDGWLTVSDNDQTCKGDIALTIDIPAEYQPYLAQFDFVIERTYRWGDGYQGHFADEHAGQPTISDYYCSLTNPNPATVAFSKTIDLEYDTSGSAFSGSSLTVFDTLYDVDGSGNKLFASVNTEHCYVNEHSIQYPWFERTQAYIDDSATNGPFSKILDHDGTPSEHEWHYLKWDWVVRKAKAQYGNWSDFDINEMTRADYKLKMVYTNGNPGTVTSSTVSGWPALTAREFAFMLHFIREVSFYRLPMTWWDEIVDMQDNQPSMSDISQSGWQAGSGKIYLRDAFAGLGGAGGDAYTDAIGISEFPGISLIFDWHGFKINTGGDTSGNRDISGRVAYVTTPRWSGSMKYYLSVFAGTLYHGVYESGPGGWSETQITYENWSDESIDDIYGNWNAYIYSVNMVHEYLSKGASGGWRASTGWVQGGYRNRMTSVNWDYPSRSYPGF